MQQKLIKTDRCALIEQPTGSVQTAWQYVLYIHKENQHDVVACRFI